MSLKDQIKARNAKILVIDIERLPGLAEAWDQKTRYIPITRFHTLPSLLCWGAKWYGSRTVEFESAWNDKARMVERSWQLYNEADIVVTYNGKRFDNKHLKSEWLKAGLAPPKPWKDVDLFQINASTFGFESKSLNHLCNVLGLDTKSGHYDSETAFAAMLGDEHAQRRMKRYNLGDVKITEQAYDRLRGWMPQHPHIGQVAENEKRCNQCGSDNLVQDGTTPAVVLNYPIYRCTDCGGLVKSLRHHSRRAYTRGAT